MNTTSSFTISKMGFFHSVKTSKVDGFLIMSDHCLPTPISVLHPRKATNAFYPMLISMFAVCSILTGGSFAKIFKTVISPVSIDVINLTDRRISSDVIPNQPVGCIMLPVNFKINIAFMVQIPGFLSNLHFLTRNVPEQKSCDRIVSKKAGEFRMTDHSVILPGYEADCKIEGDLNV